MRTKLIGVIVVLLVAVGFSITSFLVVSHAVGQVEDLAMQAEDMADQGQTEAALEKMTQLATEWQRHQRFLEMLISHDDMHAVTERYTEAVVSLRRGHMDDYYKSMALLMEMLDHVRQQERVWWGNVL